MLDLHRLNRIVLSHDPIFQRMLARILMLPNYATPPGVKIDFEGYENVPASRNVIFAMNHTDRYNYWPMQCVLWRQHDRFTATWVKGKYYENELMGHFMEWANNIPTVSRGYIIAQDFMATMGRPPTADEYRALRHWVDGADDNDLADIPNPIFAAERDVLGRSYSPASETYAEAIRGTFLMMMDRFVRLNEEAKDKGLDLLIFPQGTRSKRLSQGHIGLAQIALKLEWTIVPVGCNGSDKCYVGASPWALPGHIVYRFGKPIHYAEMSRWHIHEDYMPFSAIAERAHHANFRGLTDFLMDRINDLLDPEYQYADDRSSDGVAGSDRFV